MHSRPKTQGKNSMKKIFAALAVLGIVLGTATLITPANATYYNFAPPNANSGD